MTQMTTNPIAIQSREWLTEALLALMEEKKFRDISITEISAKAQLSRRTFYRAFGTKEDILNYYAEGLYDEFLRLLKREPDHRFASIVRLYFEFWSRHRHFLELLKKSDMLPFLQSRYSAIFPEVFQIVKGDQPLAHDPQALAYAMAFSAGGQLSILLKWVEDGMQQSPEEMVRLMELMFPNY